jgi:hypothetical protein
MERSCRKLVNLVELDAIQLVSGKNLGWSRTVEGLWPENWIGYSWKSIVWC